MRDSLGDPTVERLFACFRGRVPAETDLVCYWFEKAWRQLKSEASERVGLVATNSIRSGANRRVLDPPADADAIWEAWGDEPWVVQGAAVRVSMVAFGEGFIERRLDGLPVAQINADLTAATTDLTKASPLAENANVGFTGDTKGGPFDIPGELARTWLQARLNPNGRSNADVVRPSANGAEITKRPRDYWIIDFGWNLTQGCSTLTS